MFRRLKSATDLLGFEPLLSLALLATGLTGAAFALFMGKVYAAAILAVLCVGIFLRFKRGRVHRKASND